MRFRVLLKPEHKHTGFRETTDTSTARTKVWEKSWETEYWHRQNKSIRNVVRHRIPAQQEEKYQKSSETMDTYTAGTQVSEM